MADDVIRITKIEAARRQLRTAIELWFYDGDPISIHTLAAASHQVVHDLNEKSGGPGLMLNNAYIKDEYLAEFSRNIKHASNFMKHADRPNDRADLPLEFRPESNRDFMMFTIVGLRYVGEKLGATELAFERWHTFNDPNLMSDAGKALFEQELTVDQRALFRSIPKHKFLEQLRLSMGAGVEGA